MLRENKSPLYLPEDYDKDSLKYSVISRHAVAMETIRNIISAMNTLNTSRMNLQPISALSQYSVSSS